MIIELVGILYLYLVCLIVLLSQDTRSSAVHGQLMSRSDESA
jgi:hypothetical protein